MIHPDSRTIEWMTQVAAENKFPDITLIEKSIRALTSQNLNLQLNQKITAFL